MRKRLSLGQATFIAVLGVFALRLVLAAPYFIALYLSPPGGDFSWPQTVVRTVGYSDVSLAGFVVLVIAIAFVVVASGQRSVRAATAFCVAFLVLDALVMAGQDLLERVLSHGLAAPPVFTDMSSALLGDAIMLVAAAAVALIALRVVGMMNPVHTRDDSTAPANKRIERTP